MKISEREKNLLLIVGSILIAALYYQFVFVKQRSDVVNLQKQRDDVKSKYTTTMKMVNSLESKQEDFMNLNSKIADKSLVLYPSIIQEKIILELDELLRKSNIKANLAFSDISVKKIEYADVQERKQGENVLQTYIDQYNNDSTSSENKTSSKGKSTAKDKATSKDNSSANNLNTEQINVKMTYTGTYSDLSNFITNIENHNRDKRIVMTNLTGDVDGRGILTGSFELNFYSVPKIDDSSDDYFKYTLSSTLGKANPFNGQTTSSSIQESATAKNDFLLIARPSKSDLATLSMRYALDTKMDSTIFADNDEVEDAEITFIKENGKYYYKYKTSKSSYPKKYENEKIEFTPQGSNIVIMAMSAIRLDENDTSGVNLKVVNNTDKAVMVYLKGDDPSRPRITLESGNNVNSTKTN